MGRREVGVVADTLLMVLSTLVIGAALLIFFGFFIGVGLKLAGVL